MSKPLDQLTDDINSVAENASNQIDARNRTDFANSLIPSAIKLLMVVPAIALVVELLKWATGSNANGFLPMPVWCILTVALPFAWWLLKTKTRNVSVSRENAIRAADEKLGSSERIVTADHFMNQPEQDGFMKAAVEDATQWASRGREVTLGSETSPPETHKHLWPVPIALGLLLLAGQLARIPHVSVAEASGPDAGNQLVDDLVPAKQQKSNSAAKPPEQPEPPKPESARASDKRQRAVNRQGDANAAIPDNAEESRGKLDEGETRESQQSANPSSAKGVPSASGQPSKSGDPKQRKSKKPKKKTSEKERTKKPQKQEDDKPSGATAGQGSSKGSDNNAAPSEWSSMSQAATPDDENAEEEDEVDDEEEEQESRGGVQPNLRDRRPPVNRDLQIGFGTNRPNPDANGRGGPGGQKKSRGVASLVLGVPIPDRVNGQPNKGRIRITQQRITPEAEQTDASAAQDRTARQSPVGPVYHPEVAPWLQDYVRRYFLSQRAKHPLKSASKDNSSAPDDSMNTTQVPDISPPQS